MESSTGLKQASIPVKLYNGSGLRVRHIPSVYRLKTKNSVSTPCLKTRIQSRTPFHRCSSSLHEVDKTTPDLVAHQSWRKNFEDIGWNLKGDLFGGFTAAIVALPLALAFGVASGAGPLAGLYGAIFSGFFAACFGGTPAQVTGPTGPMTVIAATLFTQYSFNPTLAFSCICLSGIFQIIMGAMKLGRFIKLVPAPVISGFMSGIGCIILSTQLLPLCGLHAAPNALAAVQSLPSLIPQINIHAFFIGILSFGLCILTPGRITKVVPGSLLALVIGTSLSIVGGLNVPLLGQIPTQLPKPIALQFPISQIPLMLKSSFILALLGTIDSLLTSLVADNLTETYHDSNQEMIGQGIGNTITGLFGGIPGAGATMRTVVNIRSGGKTRLSGMFHSCLLLTIVMGAGGIAQSIPLAVLAGILMKTGWDIIDRRFIIRLSKLPPATGIIMWVVLLTTVFVDLIVAVAAGSILASILLVNEMSNTEVHHCAIYTSQSLSHFNDKERNIIQDVLSDAEIEMIKASDGKLGFVRMKGSFTFSAATEILKKVTKAISSLEGGVVMDLSHVSLVDGDAILTIEQLQQKAKRENKLFLVSGASPAIEKLMEKVGMELPISPTTDKTQCLYYAVKELDISVSFTSETDLNNTVHLGSQFWTPSLTRPVSPLNSGEDTQDSISDKD